MTIDHPPGKPEKVREFEYKVVREMGKNQGKPQSVFAGFFFSSMHH